MDGNGHDRDNRGRALSKVAIIHDACETTDPWRGEAKTSLPFSDLSIR